MKKSSPSMKSLLCLTNSIAPSPLQKQSSFTTVISFYLQIYCTGKSLFFCSLENDHWSRLRKPKLQTDTAAQPAHIFKCSSLTNRPFPCRVTEASGPATHLIPNVSLTCSYTSGTSVGITVLWKPPDPHKTKPGPWPYPFLPQLWGQGTHRMPS